MIVFHIKLTVVYPFKKPHIGEDAFGFIVGHDEITEGEHGFVALSFEVGEAAGVSFAQRSAGTAG